MRTLTAAITSEYQNNSYAPYYVVVLTDGVTPAGRWGTAGDITDWDGVGNHVDGKVLGISEIMHSLDWRGGLGNMSQLAVEILDDSSGTIRTALGSYHVYDIEIYFGFNAGDTKSDCIMIYKGAVDRFDVDYTKVTITTADLREKRYKRSILTRVDIDNETNLCGYGRDLSAISTWNYTIVYNDEWIPEASKGKFIPISFGRPDKAKGLLVSKWPAGHDHSAGSYDLRGPLWLFSDRRFACGENDSQDWMFSGGPFHYDSATRVYRPISESGVNQANDLQYCYFQELTYEFMGICARNPDPTGSHASNAFAHKKCLAVAWRIPAATQGTIHSDWDGEPELLFDFGWSTLTYHWIRNQNPTLAIGWNSEGIVQVNQTQIPQGDTYRALYLEVQADLVSGTMPADAYLGVRCTISGPGPSDAVSLITSAVSIYSNWEEDTAATGYWYSKPFLWSSVNPFRTGGAQGPKPIGDLGLATNYLVFGIYSGSAQSPTMEVKLQNIGLYAEVDIPILDIDMAADIERSFDGTYFTRTSGSPGMKAWETIFATLRVVLELPLDTVLSTLWSTFYDSTSDHDDNRLDFQQWQDVSGQELIDTMCYESNMWLVHDEDGLEKPIFLDRCFPQQSGDESRQTSADIDADIIKRGSFRVTFGDIGDVYNEFRLRYNLNYFDGTYEKERYVTASDDNMSSGGSTYQGWCSDSQTAYGLTRELAYSSDMIQDDTAAENFLKALIMKHVARPRRVTFTTSLAGVKWEPGDFPLLDHTLWDDVGQKVAGGTLGDENSTNFMYTSGEWRLMEPVSGADWESDNVQPGDWVYITSADLIANGGDGWHRIEDTYWGTGEYAALFCNLGTSPSTYSSVSFKIYPAMMIEQATHRQMQNEIDFTLVEIPKHATR